MDERITEGLRQAYDNQAMQRDASRMEDWKREARDGFIDLLKREKVHTVLEIGSGPGRDGLAFQDNGFDVTCIDLSPEMIRLSRKKGLKAQVMDVRHLDFPADSFDAVYALNSLLHVPKAGLPDVLGSIRSILKPGDYFFMGMYGGAEFEGVWETDGATPPRFFSFYAHDVLREIVSRFFTVISFTTRDVKPDDPYLFQSLTLRKDSV